MKTTWSALGRTRSIDTTYAKTGELTRMTVGDGTGHTTTHYFAFDVAGRLTRSASALGTRLLSYDPAGRLSTVSLGRPGPDDTLVDFASQKVAYDGWERIASLETRASDGAYSSTDAYTYDAAGRIATWNRSGWAPGSNSYVFDAAGNLTSRKVGSTLTGFAYNEANQLTTETAGSVVTTHTYDEFGRLTRTASSAEATTYAYDALGKLASVSRPGMSAAYAYGPSGMRERKDVTTSGVTKTTYSAWSGMTLVAEKDSDGTTYEYVYGGGVPLELVKTTAGGVTTRYGYQTDAAGSVIGITDEAGTVIARYAYDAYGVPTESWGTDPVVSRNPLRYRGYYLDAETSLYYLPARYYEPRSARFLSVDPALPSAGDPASLNRYAYCAGDPVNLEDPDGRKWIIGQEATAQDTASYNRHVIARVAPSPATIAADRAAQAAVKPGGSSAAVTAAALAAGRAAAPGWAMVVPRVAGDAGGGGGYFSRGGLILTDWRDDIPWERQGLGALAGILGSPGTWGMAGVVCGVALAAPTGGVSVLVLVVPGVALVAVDQIWFQPAVRRWVEDPYRPPSNAD